MLSSQIINTEFRFRPSPLGTGMVNYLINSALALLLIYAYRPLSTIPTVLPIFTATPQLQDVKDNIRATQNFLTLLFHPFRHIEGLNFSASLHKP